MFNIIVMDDKKRLQKGISLKNAAGHIKEKRSTIWIDLCKPSENEFNELENMFKLHPLAVEESKRQFHAPKVLFYDHHIFIIWNAIADKAKTKRLEMEELDIFAGENFLITVHQRPLDCLETIQQMIKNDPRDLSKGPGWILYELLDTLVDEVFPVLDRLSNEIDRLENDIFKMPSQEQIKELFVLKRQLLTIRKAVSPEREIVNLLPRRAPGLIQPEAVVYFQDIYDHLIRIVDLIDTYRDVISGTIDIYLSSVSNRMNEVMKKLTVVATIFMPLTFLVGLYGMNMYDDSRLLFPELKTLGVNFYYVLWIFMLLLAAGMLTYFRKKDWW